MKVGLTKKERRGVLVLMMIAFIVVGIDIANTYIKERKIVRNLNEKYGGEDLRPALFEFDPNTVKLPELMLLGMSRSEAVSVIRYRKYGKVFRIKEDLFTCYGISDSLYYRLEPYIVIADTFKIKTFSERATTYTKSSSVENRGRGRELLSPSKFLVDTVGEDYLVAIGALSRRQAQVFVRWRNLSGIYDMDELRECYVVSDSVASALEPYVIFTTDDTDDIDMLVDINTADSLELRTVFGIGEKSVVAILEYRHLLGGFYCVEQLSEIKVITESNYEKIIQQISCDSCDISKIDVNFASAKDMKGHPYIPSKVLRRLLKIRGLKGGWSTIEEMIVDKIFSEEEATRVRPYLLFEPFTAKEAVDDESFEDSTQL